MLRTLIQRDFACLKHILKHAINTLFLSRENMVTTDYLHASNAVSGKESVFKYTIVTHLQQGHENVLRTHSLHAQNALLYVGIMLVLHAHNILFLCSGNLLQTHFQHNKARSKRVCINALITSFLTALPPPHLPPRRSPCGALGLCAVRAAGPSNKSCSLGVSVRATKLQDRGSIPPAPKRIGAIGWEGRKWKNKRLGDRGQKCGIKEFHKTKMKKKIFFLQ